VIDLKLMGRALRLHWLWQQRTDPSKPWALMPVNDDDTTGALFRASTSIQMGNGASTLFWTERWINGQGVGELVPDMLAVMPTRRRSSRTVCLALCNDTWLRDIAGPLTLPVLTQYVHLRELVGAVQLTELDDKVLWKWCPSGSYSSRSAYAAMFIGQSGLPGVAHLWKAKAPSEHKFFMWLTIQDPCWTNDRRQRHGLSSDVSCIFCQQQTETIDHLIIACMFSCEVWFTLLQKCGWQTLSPAANDSLVDQSKGESHIASSCYLRLPGAPGGQSDLASVE
jgi:hypothetical protein